MHRRFGGVLSSLISAVFLIAGCGSKQETVYAGKTMGTIYHIKIVTGYFTRPANLKEKIDSRLLEINRSMSTYLPDSEISRFNALSSTKEKFNISQDFFNVLKVAEKLYKLTGGAWDGTVKPLVNLWGFGSSEAKHKIPDSDKIRHLLSDIGFNHIEVLENRYLRKRNAAISLDFASIAKGYAVDQLAGLIRKNGVENFLVEIGGEVFASGFRKDGRYWKVGINRPRKEAPYNQVYKAISLHGKALATSGDYRNYFEVNNKRYSHIIDPRTGYPVGNGVVSVSILADACTFADGLATAVMVMGHETGIELVDRLDGVECLIVVEKNGQLEDYYSKGFKAFIYNPKK